MLNFPPYLLVWVRMDCFSNILPGELWSAHIPVPQRRFLSFCLCLLESKTFTVEDAVETIGFGRFHIALFLIMGSTGVSAPWRLFESQKVIHHETCRTFHGLPALACPFREGCEREQEPCEVDNLKNYFPSAFWQVFGFEQMNICVSVFWEFNTHF